MTSIWPLVLDSARVDPVPAGTDYPWGKVSGA